jgi:hypothetical protein
MQVTAPERDQLRRLAELRLDRPVVLSLYLDLDPSEFATPPARATAVRSLVDEAERRVREYDSLPHEDRLGLQNTVKRVSAFLERSLPTEGAHGVAVFASEPVELFEARFARGIEKEKDDHLKNTGEALLRHFKIRPFQRLLLGGPNEVVKDFEGKLHGYLRDRVAGRIGIDLDGATPESVLESARPVFDEVEREHEARMLERVGERGAKGIDDVVAALNERRVEVLLLDEQFSGVAGAQCPECGLLATSGSTCPADGSEMIQLEELTDAAIELAVQQSAEVLAVHHDRDTLDRYGGAAAVLRF